MERRYAIRQLDESVIGKIAAGEVVERPAYAIKELVENSIDAGATAVTVEIRDGGLDWFRVVDNGCGIARNEIRLAFARHATSKLRTEADLASIHTLGFRGEALASIAAVARVEMTTRTSVDECGLKIKVEGGTIASLQDVGSPEGTAVVVRDLFFNTPARRKFLKKPATETGIISDFLMRLILARPDISLRFVNGGKQVFRSPGNGKLLDAIFSVWGAPTARALTAVSGSAAGCALEGFVGVGDAARSSRSMQTFILNGRVIRSALLSQAVEEGCRERVMIGKYPICALRLTMPYEAVDVNVHPNKLEVRFANERELLEGLAGVVRRSFTAAPLDAAPPVFVPQAPAPKENPVVVISPALRPFCPSPAKQNSSLHDAAAAPGEADAATAQAIWKPQSPPAAPGTPVPTPEQEAKSALPVQQEQTELAVDGFPRREALALRLVGVAWKEYIFVEYGETLYLIDQHAAHERILYERFQQEKDPLGLSQQLLPPAVVQLSHREHAVLMENTALLAQAGFDIEDFGNRSVKVSAVPMVLGVPQLRDFFGELADSIAEYRTLPTQEKKRDALIKLACRKAVKAGDTLSQADIDRLIAQMVETGTPPTCPHGRPLVVRIEKSELDKRFRRIV